MKRHELDVVSLISGVVLVAVAAVSVVIATTDLDIEGRWVLPIALIALGLGGLVGSVARVRRQRVSNEVQADPEGDETPANEAHGTAGSQPATRSE